MTKKEVAVFRNKMRVYDFTEMLKQWREEAETKRNKQIHVDAWVLTMMIDKMNEIYENM